jgi:hypothetical protein
MRLDKTDFGPAFCEASGTSSTICGTSTGAGAGDGCPRTGSTADFSTTSLKISARVRSSGSWLGVFFVSSLMAFTLGRKYKFIINIG